MTRKIIQITAYSYEGGAGFVALCDDGTAWDLPEFLDKINYDTPHH